MHHSSDSPSFNHFSLSLFYSSFKRITGSYGTNFFSLIFLWTFLDPLSLFSHPLYLQSLTNILENKREREREPQDREISCLSLTLSGQDWTFFFLSLSLSLSKKKSWARKKEEGRRRRPPSTFFFIVILSSFFFSLSLFLSFTLLFDATSLSREKGRKWKVGWKEKRGKKSWATNKVSLHFLFLSSLYQSSPWVLRTH